jgi:hypothetical protein
MSCIKHFLAFRWERHAWDRRVTHTENLVFNGTDQWGRAIPVDQVMCHTEYVCRACGAVRDGGDCGCEPARATACDVRLAWLAKVRSRGPGEATR